MSDTIITDVTFPGSAHVGAAVEVVNRLHDHGYTALFAGGCVRDLLLNDGRAMGDIDIATSATPQTVAKLFTNTIGVGAHFGVMVVVHRSFQFEVATFRSDVGIKDGRHPEQVVFTDAPTDAARRDFTINGMFYDPLSRAVFDYVGGRRDLQKKVIRSIGDPDLRFTEDYLRLLRAVRFAARFDFSIDPPTWQALCHHAAGIGQVSAERIFAELEKMLCQKNADVALRYLQQCGLLAIVLPELEATVGVEQPPQFHPEGCVFEHTLLMLKQLNNPSPVLAWSTLLHDIGKPPTFRITDRIRFNNHNRVGAEMAEKLLRRLKASNALIEAVYACVDNHMNFINLMTMRLGTLKKFLARATLVDEIELHRLDCLASHGNCENVAFLQEKLQGFEAEQIKPEPFIGGKDLMALGLKPGPLFGEILDAVYDLQLDETIRDKAQALEWVRGHYLNLLKTED